MCTYLLVLSRFKKKKWNGRDVYIFSHNKKYVFFLGEWKLEIQKFGNNPKFMINLTGSARY